VRTEITEPYRIFILVFARNRAGLREKLCELERIGFPFLVICGERMDHPRVRYRKTIGKWDAINFGSSFIPCEAQLILLNDADTRIHALQHALICANQADLVFCKVMVKAGPQKKFYRILDPVRRKLPIAASGELMLINRRLFERVLPIPPCTAEDTFILFRALTLNQRVIFCTETYVATVRTRTPAEEQAYKLRTTLGVYQSLGLAHPPPLIRVFYFMLPFFATLLVLAGPDGRAWAMGIEKAAVRHFLRRYGTRF